MNEIDSKKHKPTVVVRLSERASSSAREWLIQKITDDKHNGGCQLEVEGENGLLYITAPIYRLLHGAEELGFKKKYKDGSMRQFCFADGSNFKNFDDEEFLLESECHRIMRTELYGLRSVDETMIPGHPRIKLCPGKSLFHKMETNKLITDCFPLHNPSVLSGLKRKWYKNYRFRLSHPIDAVHDYFGDTIGTYFNFLNFYTLGLVPLVLINVGHLCLSSSKGVAGNWALAITNVLWSTILFELWKRKSRSSCHRWGSLGLNVTEEPRTGFRGELGVNEISHRPEPVYPSWKRLAQIYLVSLPVVALCICLTVALMFYYFSWDFHLAKIYGGEVTMTTKMIRNIPSVVYSLLIYLASHLYRRLAHYLTEQENHRLESSFQNNLITKILLFDFANNFLCLFYIAFVYDDMVMLRTTLRNLLLVHLLISQTIESLLPYWMYKYRSSPHHGKLRHPRGAFASGADLEKADASRDEQAKLELQRQTYEGTFDDYLELWLQFGYVVLFSCVYPQAAIFAFINNIVERRSDAFKMCDVVRRPFARQACGIGAWETAFQALSYLAVVSNLALIFHNDSFLLWLRSVDSSLSGAYVVFTFFFLEHVFLGMRWLISLAVPDLPHRVKVEIDRLQYCSLQALKEQKSLSIRRVPVPTN